MHIDQPMATTYPVAQSSVLPERRFLTLEQMAYLLIGVLAVLTHLLVLGQRGLHHDETLHAEYSWRLYTGQGYTHDPLLHGPFLYYWTAFIFFLFGDTDATARLAAALFGIAAVLLPVLLRREIGRGGALLASTYLLISPVFLYVGRFIRHDIFAVTFEVLAVIGLVRYLRTERPGWHYLFAAAMGLMLATMETFYLFLLILGSYVVVTLLWSVSRRTLPLLASYVALAAITIKVVPRFTGALPLVTEAQALDVRHQPDNNWAAYFTKVGPVVGPLLSHPATIMLLLLTVLMTVAVYWIVWGSRDKSGHSRWRSAADQALAGSLLRAIDRVPARQWLWAMLIASGIYAVFYTALLSNPGRPNTTGLLTGVTGSFLYWLGQHGVRRGGQPAHYYLFQLAVYEPLLVLLGGAGILMIVRAFVGRLRPPARHAGWMPTTIGQDSNLFVPGLLAWWSVFAIAIYSWAGEKMPWLTIHLVLPLALLAGWALDRMLHWAFRDGIARLVWALGGMATVIIVPALILLNVTATNGQNVQTIWFWPLLVGVAIVFLVASTIILFGARQGLFAFLVLLLVLLVPYTIRSSLRLSFANGDVPVEPLVFVQTSPDVPQAIRDLRRVAVLTGYHDDLPIRYDNETVWQWYLRNYNRTEGSGSQTLGEITDDVQAIFMLHENLQANAEKLDGFVQQRYPLRWWFPECEVYRFPARDKECGPNPSGSSLLSRFVRQPWHGETLAETWKFLMHRQLPAPLGSTDWVLLVRPDIAPHFGLGSLAAP